MSSVFEVKKEISDKTYGDVIGGGLSQGLPLLGETLVKAGTSRLRFLRPLWCHEAPATGSSAVPASKEHSRRCTGKGR